MIPIRYLVLEGPDASGKTTLYSEIHKATKFKYNIHDRSFLSMLCYARLYGRDETEHRESLRSELCEANNYVVVLMLPRDVLLQRLRTRGDDFQDESSLMRLYDIFDEEVQKLSDLPNVLVLRVAESAQDMASRVAMELQIYSLQTPNELGNTISSWTSLTSQEEVQFRAAFDVDRRPKDEGILKHPHEGEYYRQILVACHEVFGKEMSGQNPYGIPQGKDSRRFYYSSDSCISSIHCLPRGDLFRVIVTLRSTDAVRNGSPDLTFLEYLASDLHARYGWSTTKIELDVRFNSLHVRRDKV